MLTNPTFNLTQISVHNMRLIREEKQDERTHLIIACDFGGVMREWPPTLMHNGNTYHFMCQNALEGWMMDQYSGCARYRLDAVKAARIDLFGQGEE